MDLLTQRALRLNSAFAHWPEAALERIQRGARLCSYAKGERVPHGGPDGHGADLLIVVSGYLRLNRIIRGNRRQACAVGILGPGRVWRGRSEDDAGTGLRFEQLAHEQAVVIHVGHEALTLVLAQFPVLWRDLGTAMLKHQREMIETVVEQTRGTAIERLSNLLIRFQEQHGCNQVGSRALRMRMSQEDLGSLAQLCRQTANEALGRLQEAGVLRVDYSCVSVTDESALRRAAGRLNDAAAVAPPKREPRFEPAARPILSSVGSRNLAG